MSWMSWMSWILGWISLIWDVVRMKIDCVMIAWLWEWENRWIRKLTDRGTTFPGENMGCMRWHDAWLIIDIKINKRYKYTRRFSAPFPFNCPKGGVRGTTFPGGTPSNMFAAKDLKVGHRYKVPTPRTKDGLGPCVTLTRKQHLANGIRYALTFHNGKERRGQFYNFTENPVFKSCRQRYTRKSKSNRKSKRKQ